MVKYVLKRLGYILVTLWIIITCTFFLMKNLPGTPFDAERFSIMTPAQQEKVLEMYGLNILETCSMGIWELHLPM